MLVELPRFFGGDPREGERLLRRAVALDPDDPQMRLMLASVLRVAGQREQALPHASIARGVLGDLRAIARTLVVSSPTCAERRHPCGMGPPSSRSRSNKLASGNDFLA